MPTLTEDQVFECVKRDQRKARFMPCWGEADWADDRPPMRLFAPSEGSYVCSECGWLQSSSIGGIYELVMSATWYPSGLPLWKHYASTCERAGLEVPDAPPNFEEDE